MKINLTCIVLFLIVLIKHSIAFQTSSESVNPFNQFMAPSGGVNLYSGDVAYTHPIVTLPGRANMNASVILSYSSNIHANVRANNEVAPTGWLGLGWHLNYGSIHCNHKGTKTHNDDEFVWISPAGVGSKILKENGKYFIKEDPYTKIEPQVNSDGVFGGWILTAVDGKKMKYGDLNYTTIDPDDKRYSTRWTFAWGEFVGPGMAGNPVQYPAQWDLSEIADLNNNAVKYYYSQTNEELKVGSWTSPVKYTKASYVVKIVTPEKKRIEFKLKHKGSEVYDPYIYSNEPDGFMEFFEDSLIEKVKVYNNPGLASNPISVSNFEYSVLNTSLGNEFKKSILSRIKTYNGNETSMLTETVFHYNNDISREGTNDYHYGALCYVLNSAGSLTQFSYAKQVLNVPKSFVWTNVYDGGQIKTGMLSDGNPYVVLTYGINGGCETKFFNWDGSRWIENLPVGSINDGMTAEWPFPTGTDNVIIRHGFDKNYLSAYHWDGEKWVRSKFKHFKDNTWVEEETIIPNPLYEIEVYPGGDWFALRIGENKDFLQFYNWDGTKWVQSANPTVYQPGGDNNEIDVYVGKNYAAVRCASSQKRIKIYQWDGISWHESFTEDPGGENIIYPSAGEDFLTLTYADHTKSVKCYQWTGTQWIATLATQVAGEREAAYSVAGRSYIAVSCADKQKFIRFYNWNGSNWYNAYTDQPANEKPTSAIPGSSNFVAVRNADDQKRMQLYKWDRTNWTKVSYDYGIEPIDAHPIDIRFGNDFISVVGGEKHDMQAIYTFDGQKWNKKYKGKPINCTEPMLHEISNNVIVIKAGHSGQDIGLFYKFQDNLVVNGTGDVIADVPIYTYVVSRKTVYDNIQGQNIETAYTFGGDSCNYDTRAGTAKFNKVEIKEKNNGKTVQYFFNDSKANNQNVINSEYRKLDGMTYRTEIFNQNEAASELHPISRSTTNYAIYHNTQWPEDMYQKIINDNSSTTYGVRSTNQIIGYNPVNGLPHTTRVANSGGKEKLTETKFAFDWPPYSTVMGTGTGGLHMLSQPCQAVVYGREPGEGMEPYALSASATTWSNTLGCAAWVPYKTYVWKTDCDQNGMPKTGFTNFNFENPEGNSVNKWVYTKTNSRYNQYGLVTEMSSVGPNSREVFSSVVIRNDLSLPVASVANAGFKETGVFTGDYDLDETVAGYFSYFDKENGWEKSNGVVVDAPANRLHYGQKVLKIQNGEGAMRNFKIQANKEYIASAWVYVESGSGNGFYLWAEVRKGAAPTDAWPNKYGNLPAVTSNATSDKLTTTGGKWQLIEVKIPAQPDPGTGNELWVRLTVGRDGETFLAYVDDIRFRPKNAMVTSTYYDQKWYQAILSVDANNNPSQKITYDGFGRPVRWHKINKNDPSDVTLLQEKEYHLMGLPNVPPEVPAGLFVTVNYPQLTFKWNGGDFDEGQTIVYSIIVRRFPGGVTPITIGTFSAPASQKVFEETFTPTSLPDGDYYWSISATDGVKTVECDDGDPTLIIYEAP